MNKRIEELARICDQLEQKHEKVVEDWQKKSPDDPPWVIYRKGYAHAARDIAKLLRNGKDND